MGGVKTPLTPFLSRSAGHHPLREALILFRAADHNTLFRADTIPYKKRSLLQITIPCERLLILLRAAGHNNLKEVLSQGTKVRHMVTKATNPFCESMGQRVTCLKALDLHLRFTLEFTCVDPNSKCS